MVAMETIQIYEQKRLVEGALLADNEKRKRASTLNAFSIYSYQQTQL